MQISASTPTDGDRFPLAVLTRYVLTPNLAWSDGRWQVEGVVAGEQVDRGAGEPRQVHNGVWLWPGLEVSLHKDQAESYYLNLVSDKPSVFLVCTHTSEGQLKPVLGTLSFDEAAAYEEGDQVIADVPMPAEVYQWLEAFVIAHYIPEKRRKRKRDNWK